DSLQVFERVFAAIDVPFLVGKGKPRGQRAPGESLDGAETELARPFVCTNQYLVLLRGICHLQKAEKFRAALRLMRPSEAQLRFDFTETGFLEFRRDVGRIVCRLAKVRSRVELRFELERQAIRQAVAQEQVELVRLQMAKKVLITDVTEFARVILLGVVGFILIERVDQQLAFAYIGSEKRGLHAVTAVAQKVGCRGRVRFGRRKTRAVCQQHQSRQLPRN